MLSNALEYITIKSFKSIASIEKLALKPINVVIGANGSGKSNFIGAFGFVHEISEGRLQNYVTKAGGAEKLLYFGSSRSDKIELHLSFNKDANQYPGAPTLGYELTLSPTADDGLFFSREGVWLGPYLTGLTTLQPGREAGISGLESHPVAKLMQAHFRTWQPWHLHDTSPMRKTARVDDNRFLRPDGSNLPAFLHYLRERYQEFYRLIVRTVQRVAPFLDDFQLNPLQLKPDDIKLEWRHKGSDQYFDATALSDGTLRFIALATLFLQPPGYHRPSLILVDELELGLHPYAIEILASLIRQASVTTQVIVSTQSPLLVDHFEPEDILVADLVDDGTQLRRLESSQLAKWLEDYSLGQLWEKNEFGGRPVHA